MQHTTIIASLATIAIFGCANDGRGPGDVGVDPGADAGADTSTREDASDSAAPVVDSGVPDVATPPVAADSWLGGFGAGAEQVLDVASDRAGNVYVVGLFEGEIPMGDETLASRGEKDVVVIKYDPSGGLLWAQSFGGTTVDQVGGIAVDDDGNSYVAGTFSDPLLVGGRIRLEPVDQEDFFLASFDTDGEARWARAYGGRYAESATDVAVGGGVVCVSGHFQGGFDFGATTLAPNWQFDAFVGCVSADDAVVKWARAFAGFTNDVATAVAVDSVGDVLVGLSFGDDLDVFGETLENRGGFDAALVKISTLGEHLFTLHVGGEGPDEMKGIDVDEDDNVYFTGVFSRTLTLGGVTLTAVDAHDVYVASVDPSGEQRWATSFGSLGFDQPLDLEVGAGRVHVTGRFDEAVDVAGHEIASAGDYDAFLATYDEAGTAIGAWAVGSAGGDQANGVAPDPYGGAYVGGHHTATITMGDTMLSVEGRLGAFVAHLASTDIDLI